jgi:hypothetical protein
MTFHKTKKSSPFCSGISQLAVLDDTARDDLLPEK